MKKYILTSAIILALPMIALSAPSLASKLQGKILLAVEDKGKTYCVSDGFRYQVTKDNALEVFKACALGISDKDLDQIPLKDLNISARQDSQGPEMSKSGLIQETCDYTSYTGKIAQLESEIKLLKESNSKLNNDLGYKTSKDEMLESLKKEYGLKINALQSQLIELNALKENEPKIRYLYYDPSKTDFLDTDFKRGIVNRMMEHFKTVRTADTAKDIRDYLQNEISTINTQISVLNIELDKRLLESK
jgi:hypothetical protein